MVGRGVEGRGHDKWRWSHCEPHTTFLSSSYYWVCGRAKCSASHFITASPYHHHFHSTRVNRFSSENVLRVLDSLETPSNDEYGLRADRRFYLCLHSPISPFDNTAAPAYRHVASTEIVFGRIQLGIVYEWIRSWTAGSIWDTTNDKRKTDDIQPCQLMYAFVSR